MACRRTSASFLGFISRLLVFVGGLFAVAGLSGCTRVTLVDNVDLVLDWSPLVGPSNALNSPYVEGSSMRIYIESTNNSERFAGWRLESLAPQVFSVEPLQFDNVRVNDKDEIVAWSRAQAKSPGNAELRVIDENGQDVGGGFVEVRRPDELRLLDHGMLLVGHSEEEARVVEPRILTGGTGTYLARYYFAGTELHGNGALSVASEPIGTPVGGSAKVAKSYIFEDRDWLQLGPANPGNVEVSLMLNGTAFAAIPLFAVPSTDIVGIRILNSDESRAKNGDWLVSYAQALDASGRPILGAEYTWQMDTTKQTGLGDLFRYEYDQRQPKMLSAAFGGFSAQTFVHSKKGFVDSTNRIGCSAAPGEASSKRRAVGVGISGAILIMIVARAARRRRDQSKSS